MNLANYINDLLYRYDCVIVPNFGGFVTNRISSKINETTQTFSPPTKQITFNSHLKVSDGLLANYIASSENISFEKAANAIALSVVKWKNELQTKPLQLNEIGVLSLNESGQIIFEPNLKINYLAESFGLATVTTTLINSNKSLVKPLPVVDEKAGKKVIPMFIKYAAAAAILVTIGFLGNNAYLENEQQNLVASQEKALEKKIQTATFVISNPLPTIELNVAKKIPTPFHVVAGAFQFPENAEKKVQELIAKGYNAKVIGVNKWGLTEVVYNSFADRNDAINNLYKIQKTVSKDAWLLVKK